MMELVKLNANNQAAKPIEQYDSLVWTERYALGGFVLTTGNINKFMQLLPKQSRVSLRDSDVPMIVETHQIERKKNQPEKLTITGRSFDSILDRRAATAAMVAAQIPTKWIINTKTPSDLAMNIIADICIDGVLDLQDKFPASQVQFVIQDDFMTSTGPVKEYDVTRGNLLSVVLDLLKTEYPADPTTTPVTPAQVPHGIRSIRPGPNETAIKIKIYKGVDRRNQIYFDARRNLLDDGTYLFSDVGSANVAYGIADNLAVKMQTTTVEPDGLDRRVILVDASSTTITDIESMRSLMSISLSEARETSMFDGSINQDLSPYKYGKDYFLGDIVKVAGDYGLDEFARVTEFIRSSDASGYKEYPTLTTIIE